MNPEIIIIIKKNYCNQLLLLLFKITIEISLNKKKDKNLVASSTDQVSFDLHFRDMDLKKKKEIKILATFERNVL